MMSEPDQDTSRDKLVQLRGALDVVERSLMTMHSAVRSAGLSMDPLTFNAISDSVRQVQEDLARALIIAERL